MTDCGCFFDNADTLVQCPEAMRLWEAVRDCFSADTVHQAKGHAYVTVIVDEDRLVEERRAYVRHIGQVYRREIRAGGRIGVP